MSEQKEYYLHIDGQPIKVSKEVYQEYYRGERKEKYFMMDLKLEDVVVDQQAQTVTFIPSREDSYERLIEVDEQFATSEESVEDMAVRSILLEHLDAALHTLTDEEQELIWELFYLNRTEREISAMYRIAPSTVHYKKQAVLRKLWNLLERFFNFFPRKTSIQRLSI